MLIGIAGGSGFVGLAVAEALLQQGAHVLLVDIKQPPEAALRFLGEHSGLGALEVQVADVTNPGEALQALKGIDALVCAAAVTSGEERERDRPTETLETNILGFTNLLNAARHAGAKRIINLSSASAYGISAFEGDGDITEDGTWPKPNTLYGVSKLASEGIAARLAELWAADIVNVRLSAVYGPWERDTGRRDTLSPHLQAATLMFAGQVAVLPRRCARDWTDSRKVAQAVAALLRAKVLGHKLYNVSAGKNWTVADWLDALVALRPEMSWHLADADEESNVDLHGLHDRRPISNERFRNELGLDLWLEPGASAQSFLDWRKSTPGYWQG